MTNRKKISIKILALTRYSTLGASSRFRIYQYLPYLREHGCEFTIQPLLSDKYISHLYNKTPLPLLEIIKKYFERILLLLRKNQFDIIWLQQEAFPWIPAWFETALIKSNVPVIVDYDDAFFHRYDMNKYSLIKKLLGKKIDKIMSIAEVVVVGNQYLAERAIQNKAKNVKILPTVIDFDKYAVKTKSEIQELFTIGWVGSPLNSKYVKYIESELRDFCYKSNSIVHLIGTGIIELKDIPHKIISWNESTELIEIRKFDVGIMPLMDNPWERGKCGFKLIQYMACGIPVIASPVGINQELVTDGVNGFLAKTEDDWLKYLKILKNNPDLRKQMGLNGRKLVEDKFTLQINAPILTQILRKAAFPS
ncbi:MAG: glycosyltransferase family 4 protein [Ignavibacteriales bacterium]|nr:glycosyltransferase family 4 protein [Ignavibacteriales bacterium]